MSETRQERRRRDTADEIVLAAEQIVLDSDLDSLTVQRIAAALGMTAGALYRYFPSRDAIVAAVQRRVVVDLVAAIDRAVETAIPGPVARIEAVAAGIVGYARAEPARYSLLSRMFAVPRVVIPDAEVAQVVPVVVGAVTRARALFAVARTEGLLTPGDDGQRLLALWAAVHGAIQLDKLSRFAPEIGAEGIAGEAVRTLLAGWRCR